MTTQETFTITPLWELNLTKSVVLKPKPKTKYKVTAKTLFSLPSGSFTMLVGSVEYSGSKLANYLSVYTKSSQNGVADLFNRLFGKLK